MKKIIYKILKFIFTIILYLCIIILFFGFLLVLKGVCTNDPIYIFQGVIIGIIIPFIVAFSLGIVRHCNQYFEDINIERINYYDY